MTGVTATLIYFIKPIPSLWKKGSSKVKWKQEEFTTPLALICPRTWAPAHPHSSRQSHQTSHSESCSGAGLETAWRRRLPSVCCRQSAAPSRLCTHCTDCRSCQLSLGRKNCRHRSPDSRKKGGQKHALQLGRHIHAGVH